jgi:hypothetical protein
MNKNAVAEVEAERISPFDQPSTSMDKVSLYI